MFEQILINIFRDLGVQPKKALELAKLLGRMYNEPHRFYHNARHIERMLGAFYCLNGSRGGVLVSKPPMAFAIIFHDAIYHPAEKKLEEKSCQWMREQLEGYILPSYSYVLDEAERLIMLTANHLTLTTSDVVHISGAGVLLNLDLMHLADPYPEFVRQQEAVISEYSLVYDADFVNTEQKKFLRKLFDKDRIFFRTSEWGVDERTLEEHARSNIQRFIES